MASSTPSTTPQRLPGDAPDPEEIGQAGWLTLHTIAAAYPNNPSEMHKSAMRDFMRSWSLLYSCGVCADHLRRDMATRNGGVIPVGSKREISTYVCELHNSVNRRLGKWEYDCSPEAVLRKWHPTYPYMDDELVVADDETDPVKVMMRVKKCEAFCPKGAK
eukprot:PhM_4_TR10269/c0_g1_i1/m.66398/K17783/ERV1, GFER, ALR; mitochondrial FAD-linked sulfhydryl oxidase